MERREAILAAIAGCENMMIQWRNRYAELYSTEYAMQQEARFENAAAYWRAELVKLDEAKANESLQPND